MNQAVVRLLERPRVYLAWQRPFVASKLSPVLRHNDLGSVRRVLDVGCGPGTNSSLFADIDYMGVDLNPSYIELARQRHGERFEVADVRTDPIPRAGTYDFVLVNSLLHHLDDEHVDSLLGGFGELMSEDGHVHVIELELPAERGLPRTLARADRGPYARSIPAWRSLLARHFDEVVLEPFPVPARGPAFWRMVYFKGKLRFAA